MSKERLDRRQTSLDLEPHSDPVCGPALIGMQVMADVQRQMRRRNLSRDQLAEFLSKKLGRDVQKTTVDMWFCETKPDKFPAFQILIVVCDFVGSYGPLQVLAETRGLMVIEEEEQRLLEVGKAAVDKQVLLIREEKLSEKIQSVIAHRVQRGELKL